MGVALFDFDRTLIDVNSGTLWLRHEVRAGRVGWKDAVWATIWFTRYHLGLASGLDAAFEQAVAAYKGMTDEELRALTVRFFEEEIAAHLRPGAREALDRHREAGDRLALCSSTTQYLAELACEAWDLELAARTELEVADGVLTGRIASLALGDHKTTRTLEWAAAESIDLTDCTFYTDSFTDVKLLREVGTPVVVHPDRQLSREARRQGWQVADWGRAGPPT